MTLRQRVALALITIVALFVLAQGTLAYLSLREQEDDLVDDMLVAQTRELAARIARGDLQDRQRAEALLRPSPTLTAWYVSADGQVQPEPLPAYLAGLLEGTHRLGRPWQELHVAVLPSAGGRLIVQYDAERHEAKVREFGLYLLGLAAIFLAIGAIVAWQVAGWVVGPLARLTAQLSAWAPPAGGAADAARDEEHRLLAAFARVQERFERMLAREREFIANLGHEIRTPLAALRTDLELAASAADPQPSRLARALAAADAIASALDAAGHLAQGEQGAATPIDLIRCVHDAWGSLQGLAGIERVQLVVRIAPGTTVAADRHALLTILRNLFRNAVEHGAPTQCEVRYADGRIEVIDDGAGIAPEEMPFVFDRYFRGRLRDTPQAAGADGRGLGLAIARQMAELNGWTLQVQAAGDGARRGAKFVLTLAAV
ncbi:MAG: HAMP domain-containing histidine kinase [Burkholderiaceae bacterium]|nr:HAMP domain-containing histidine kinase [Burkholderiaceae bacterium]